MPLTESVGNKSSVPALKWSGPEIEKLSRPISSPVQNTLKDRVSAPSKPQYAVAVPVVVMLSDPLVSKIRLPEDS